MLSPQLIASTRIEDLFVTLEWETTWFTERKSNSSSQLKEAELLQVTYNCMEKRHLQSMGNH